MGGIQEEEEAFLCLPTVKHEFGRGAVAGVAPHVWLPLGFSRNISKSPWFIIKSFSVGGTALIQVITNKEISLK